MEIPEYLPGGKHVSSSIGRFVNFFGPKPDAQVALRECGILTGEPCTIIDGSDDWSSPRWLRPQLFVEKAKVVAWFHTGVSGITRSGVVVRSSDMAEIKDLYMKIYTQENWDKLKITSA